MNILITGASKGIGRALAKKYACSDNKLFLISRNEEALKGLIEELHPYQAEYFALDITNRNNVINTISEIYLKNHIDLAILNAGISINHQLSNLNSSIIEEIYKTNIYGVFYFIEGLLPYFKKQNNSKIAVVGSLAESRGLPGSAIYCSSKIALSHILEALRIELKEYGIKIISIKPGFIDTDMVKKNKFKMPFLLPAERAAEIIYSGIELNKYIISFPKPMALLSYLGKITPSIIFEYIVNLWYKTNKKKLFSNT